MSGDLIMSEDAKVAVARLEGEFSGVKTQVASIDEKMDTLIEAFGQARVESTKAFGKVETDVARIDDRVESHRAASDLRMDAMDTEIASAKTAAASAGGPTKGQAVVGVGGAGVLATGLTVFLNWLAKTFGLGGPPTG